MSAAKQVYDELNCQAIANGFEGLRQLVDIYYKENTPGRDELWYCQTCDAWFKEPERTEEGAPICIVCASDDVSQSPF